MIADPAILKAIETVAPQLVVPPEVDARAVLAAITMPETNWGERCEAGCFEIEYYRGGRWFNAEHVRRLVQKYEALASCSYGPWQILFITAWELGYREHPARLRHPEISAPWVVTYMNKRVKNASSAQDYADAWNSGTNADRFIPHKYVEKFLEAYAEALGHYRGGP